MSMFICIACDRQLDSDQIEMEDDKCRDCLEREAEYHESLRDINNQIDSFFGVRHERSSAKIR